MNRFGERVFHPFLIGLFPIIFLYARNVTEVRFQEIFLPAGLVLLAVGAGLLLLKSLIRDRLKRGLVASVFIFLFILFGPLLNQVEQLSMFAGRDSSVPELIVGGGLLLILTLLGAVILRSRRDLSTPTRLLNQVLVSLLVIQIALAGYAVAGRGETVAPSDEASMPVMTTETTPDIYYIILDGYARSDVLKSIYDYDNSEFLDQLTERGFYIADSTFANYNSTAQSLTSALNLDYLHRVMPADRNEFSRMPTARMMENNRVTALLRRYGYRTVSFSSGYTPTEMDYADYFFAPGWALSEFQNHLLNSTPIPLLVRGFKSQHDLHRERLNFIIDKLSDLDQVPSPMFVMAHISWPHPPFVVLADGRPVEPDWPITLSDGSPYFNRTGGTLEDYLLGYRNQVTYVSRRILRTIDSILVQSEEPPVILLQADHGPGSRLDWESLTETDLRERFSILNAYHLPGVDATQLYRGISPVNSFRVVLNQYFGTEYPPLPDLSFYTTWTRPYDYHDITDSLRGRSPGQ